VCQPDYIESEREHFAPGESEEKRESESECGPIVDLGWRFRKDSNLKVSGKGCECLISSDIWPLCIKTHPECF